MASQELLNMLNNALARELQVCIQYMWHHVMVTGPYAEEFGTAFRTIALQEMLHAEMIAERIDYLGDTPTTVPAEIKLSRDAMEMLRIDKAAEEEAIEMYRNIIEKAEREKDYTTKRLFEQILSDEENHHNTFKTLLGE